MTRFDENEFDDPGLKAAIQRSCAGETAPRELRRKVSERFTAGAAIDYEPRRRTSWRNSRLVAFAAAAAIVLAVGSVAWQIRSMYPAASNRAYSHKLIPPSLLADILKTHDACAALGDHHLVP